MKRGKQILGLLLLLVVLLVIASSARWTALPEPEYNGKKLSQWAELFQHGILDEDSSIRDQAVQAAHQTRDQLVPYALKLLKQEPPAWQTALVRKLAISKYSSRIPRGLWQWLNRDPSRISTTYFAMLGSDASSAVPELLSDLKQTKSDMVSSRAISALCYIGGEGQVPLAEMVTDPAYPHRRQTAYIIEDLQKQGVMVDAMVPALVNNLAASDHEAAKATAYSLGQMAIEPDIVVPALTNCLQSTDIYLRGAALDALAKFRERASSAMPALIAELDDPDPSVRKWATNALTRVAPKYFAVAVNWVSTPFDLSTP